jgi:hypothetical protein
MTDSGNTPANGIDPTIVAAVAGYDLIAHAATTEPTTHEAWDATAAL